MLKTNFNFRTEGEAFPLDRARPGAELVVDHVQHDDSPASRRLSDLGILPDTAITVVRRAPLGDPVEYALRGYRLCLRSTDSARIWVRRLAEDGSAKA